jgi:hypothetical protein
MRASGGATCVHYEVRFLNKATQWRVKGCRRGRYSSEAAEQVLLKEPAHCSRLLGGRL